MHVPWYLPLRRTPRYYCASSTLSKHLVFITRLLNLHRCVWGKPISVHCCFHHLATTQSVPAWSILTLQLPCFVRVKRWLVTDLSNHLNASPIKITAISSLHLLLDTETSSTLTVGTSTQSDTPACSSQETLEHHSRSSCSVSVVSEKAL